MFLAVGANVTFAKQSSTDAVNGANFLDYYYQSAFLVKAALGNLASEIQLNNIEECDTWKLRILWMLCAFLVYLVLYMIFVLSYSFHRRNQQDHYTIFYTVIPKELRTKSDELRRHVKHLVKMAD